MLIYGYELEFVIHHDFVGPIVVNVAREKWDSKMGGGDSRQDVDTTNQRNQHLKSNNMKNIR